MARAGLAVVLLIVLPGCAAAPPSSRAAGGSRGEPAGGAAPEAAPADPGEPDGAGAAVAVEEPGAAGDADEADELDDGLELPPEDPGAAAAPPASPLAAMTDAEIEEKLASDPAALGSMSLGTTNAGALFNGVQMPDGDAWELIDRGHAWGTQETVDYLARAIREVGRRIPGGPKLSIGHISARTGGHLSPHVSHQAGRDADVGYYYVDGRRGFQRVTAANLDRERTWTLVRALLTETDVELILIDSGVQRLLKEHALGAGEDAAWLDEVFQVGSQNRRPMIRHAKGHANHLHVRFYNPVAQASAARVFPVLMKQGKVQAPAQYVRHTVKSGQTLGVLAKRYGTTVEAIQRANGLRSTRIQARRTLNIPRAGRREIAAPPAPPRVPPRRLPPAVAAPAPAPAAERPRGPVLDG